MQCLSEPTTRFLVSASLLPPPGATGATTIAPTITTTATTTQLESERTGSKARPAGSQALFCIQSQKPGFPFKTLERVHHRKTLCYQAFSLNIATLVSLKIQTQRDTPSLLPALNECVLFFQGPHATSLCRPLTQPTCQCARQGRKGH